jgi:hypothetical protein
MLSLEKMFSLKKIKRNLSELEVLKNEALLYNAFNRLELSIQKLNLLFEKYSGQLSNQVKYNLQTIKQSNHSKIFEYKIAFKVFDEILTKYSTIIIEKG